MNKEDIEWLIIELLAEDSGVEPGDLWDELAELGVTMPVDSLLAVEILTRIEERTGVELSTTAENARALRSVKSFAEVIWGLLPKADSGEVASA